MFSYVNAQRKTPLEIHFIYSSNDKIYCILGMLCNLCLIFHKMLLIFLIEIEMSQNDKG